MSQAPLDPKSALALWLVLAHLEIAAADGEISPSETAALLTVLSGYGLPNIIETMGWAQVLELAQKGTRLSLAKALVQTIPEEIRAGACRGLIEVVVADGAAEPSELSALVAVSAELGVSAAALGLDADASLAKPAAGVPLEKQGLWFTLAALTLADADGQTSQDEVRVWREGCSQLGLPDPSEKSGIDAVKKMAAGGVRQAIAPALQTMPAQRRIEFILMLMRVAGVDASLGAEEAALMKLLVAELGLTMTAGPSGLQFADAHAETAPDESPDPLTHTRDWITAALCALAEAPDEDLSSQGAHLRALAREAKEKAASLPIPTEHAEALVKLAERIRGCALYASAGGVASLLGHLFENGVFLEQDRARALKWYRAGAAAGHHVCAMKLSEHGEALSSGVLAPQVLRSGGAGPAPALASASEPAAGAAAEPSTVDLHEPTPPPTPAEPPTRDAAPDSPPAEPPEGLATRAVGQPVEPSPTPEPHAPEQASDSPDTEAGGHSAAGDLTSAPPGGAGGSNPLSMASVGLGVLGTVCSLVSVLPGAVCLSVVVNLTAIATGAMGLKQAQESGVGKTFSMAGAGLGAANLLLTIVVCIVWFFGRQFF